MLASGLACAASSSETALTTIDSALHSKNPDTRREAVKALAVLGSKQPYQGRLESMLKDKDGKVRLAAVASLSESKNAPALREALDDQIPEVRFAAAKALFNMNDPAGREALIRILNGDSKTASNFIAEQKREALRTLQTPRPLMIIALRQGVQFVPLPGLGEGISVTEKVLSNSGSSDRAAVATLLGKKKDPPRSSMRWPTKTRRFGRRQSRRSHLATIPRWPRMPRRCSTTRTRRSGCAPPRATCGSA
jgi:HEAT repeat protein